MPESELEAIGGVLPTGQRSIEILPWQGRDKVVVLAAPSDPSLEVQAGTPGMLYLVGRIDGNWKLLAETEPHELEGDHWRLDLAPYRLNETETLIGFRFKAYPTKVDNQYLTLFRRIGTRLLPVLMIDMEGLDYDYSSSEGITETYRPYTRTLAVAATRTQGVYDLISTVHIRDTGTKVRRLIRWEGAKYQSVPLALDGIPRARGKRR